MAEQEPNPDGEVKIEPEDPEQFIEEHILFKRKLDVLNRNLKKLLQQNVSEFLLIMDGSTAAFTKLSLNNKGIREINEQICQYTHLRKIELNNNLINDTSYIQKLKFVVSLDLSRNLIQDNKFMSNEACFPYLKTLNLANNKIKYLPGIALKNLRHLNLNGNEIMSLDEFEGHPIIEVLELRSNKINNLVGLKKCQNLRELYLADNQLNNLNGLEDLPKLTKVHLRKNKFTQLTNFPKINSIKYLNLRENQIPKVDLIGGISKSVEILNLLANPISQELGDNTKKQIWMRFRNYQKINKVEITAQEKEQFDKEYKDRLAEQERERLQKQAADRQAREQAQRQAAEAAEKAAQQ